RVDGTRRARAEHARKTRHQESDRIPGHRKAGIIASPSCKLSSMKKARSFLPRGAALVAAMDDVRSEVPDASVLVRGNTIEAVGHATALPSHADEVIDCRN